MRIVRRCLKAPRQLARVRIDRDDAAGPWVVARTRGSVQRRRRIAGADEDEIELRIVGARHPHLSARGTAARQFRRAGWGRAVEDPLRLAVFGIERFEQSRQVVEIAGHADDHVIADDERRRRRPVAALGIRDHDIPLDGSANGVERDEVCIGCREVDGVLVHRDAAMTDVKTGVGWIRVPPDLAARSRIERPEIVGGRDVRDPVHHDWRRFDLRRLPGLECPRERELIDVGRRERGQRAMPPA